MDVMTSQILGAGEQVGKIDAVDVDEEASTSGVAGTSDMACSPYTQMAPTKYYCDSEFGELKKVLVGRADGFRLPAYEHEPLLAERNVHGVYTWVGKPYPDKVIEEANASLEELCTKLKQEIPDIEIVRSSMEAEGNHTEKAGNRGYSTRDVMIAVRNTLYLCPSVHQSRAHEAEDCFSSVIEDFKNSEGNEVVDLRSERWWELVNATDNNLRAKDAETEEGFLKKLKEKAAMLDKENEFVKVGSLENEELPEGCERFAKLTDADYFSDKLPDELPDSDITEEVPIFDAANVLVASDKYLVYLISISGNYHGFVYLKQAMKEHGINVLPVARIYSGTHIDSTMCILNEDKILYNHLRMSLDQCFNIMRHCGYTDKERNYIPVYEEDMYDVGLFNEDQNFASIYIGMNLLAITRDTLIVEAKQTKLIAKLEEHGFKIITVSYPHMRSMGGGVHCTTLPLLRL
jgi:hypothetical protein